MNYGLKILILSLFSLLILGCSIPGQYVEIVTNENLYRLNVEIAETDEEKRQGLMFRESLDEDEGMLFIYDSEQELSFWMKNMLMPLDMLFINSDLEIIYIAENVPPCENSDCQSYSSPESCQYVLEINAGVSDKLNIKAGDRVVISLR